MRTRGQVAWAVLASVILHGVLGLSLARLPNRGGEAVASGVTPPTYVIHGTPAVAVQGRDKLLSGESAPSNLAISWLPAQGEIHVPVADNTPSHFGSSLPGVPGDGGLKSGSAGGENSFHKGNNNFGNGTSTTFFRVPTQGQKIVYVIDRSASMGLEDALTTAKRELLTSLRQLPATAFFQVIVYNNSEQVLVGHSEKLVPATTANVGEAAAALEALEPSGGTRHLSALTLALNLQPDTIFFLTDADDLSEADRKKVTELNHSRATIHTIELTLAHIGLPAMPMQVLATTTGGTYRAIDLAAPR